MKIFEGKEVKIILWTMATVFGFYFALSIAKIFKIEPMIRIFN